MTFLAEKDPDSVEDFSIDWEDRLGSDTISSSDWAKTGDVTLGSESNTSTTTTTWVSAGTAGTQAKLINTIQTTGGRTLERTITLLITDK